MAWFALRQTGLSNSIYSRDSAHTTFVRYLTAFCNHMRFSSIRLPTFHHSGDTYATLWGHVFYEFTTDVTTVG